MSEDDDIYGDPSKKSARGGRKSFKGQGGSKGSKGTKGPRGARGDGGSRASSFRGGNGQRQEEGARSGEASRESTASRDGKRPLHPNSRGGHARHGAHGKGEGARSSQKILPAKRYRSFKDKELEDARLARDEDFDDEGDFLDRDYGEGAEEYAHARAIYGVESGDDDPIALDKETELYMANPDGVDVEAFLAKMGERRMDNTRLGFVAVIGRPNVGKSTLVNHLVGQKISITSKKAQTTRQSVRGILTVGDTQMVFVDTPGFQTKKQNALNQRLNQNVLDALKDVDLVLFVAEANRFGKDDEEVLDLLPGHERWVALLEERFSDAGIGLPEDFSKAGNDARKLLATLKEEFLADMSGPDVMLVVNKSDKFRDLREGAAFIERVESSHPFSTTMLTSAKHGRNIPELVNEIRERMPEGMFLYPEDMMTDRSVKFLCSEIIREKLFRYLGEELPYSTYVEIENYEESPELARIHALVLVEKTNQRGIVIGNGGERLKKISTEARLDMEKLLGKKVYVMCYVKVKSGWSDDTRILKDLGLN